MWISSLVTRMRRIPKAERAKGPTLMLYIFRRGSIDRVLILCPGGLSTGVLFLFRGICFSLPPFFTWE